MQVKDSPLEKCKWNDMSFYVKREDCLTPGGGNKVRRFYAFFQQYPKIKKMVTLSDRGSHTFFIANFFQADNQKFLFLERKSEITEYTERNRQSYMSNKNIKVISEAFWKLLMIFCYYRFFCFDPTIKTIGIGGKISKGINPSKTALKECITQLDEFNETGRFIHLFPIASGQMAEGFLEANLFKTTHRFFGVMTGDRSTVPMLLWKFKNKKDFLTLMKKKNVPAMSQEEKAQSFYEETGIWLDPIHTIHLLSGLEEVKKNGKDVKVILWVTCPFQASKPSYS